MDLDYRNSEIEKIYFSAKEISDLKFLKRTYSLYEIAIMTRASPAKILGLTDRGSLGEGCIADISIYDPKKKIDEMFANAKYVFKNGDEIVRNGKALKYKKTTTQALSLKYDKKIHKNIQRWFDNFYSLQLDSFEIDTNYFEENNFKYVNSF